MQNERSDDLPPDAAALSPSAYAPYDDPRDYITSWTDRIWITRGLGHLRDHYAKDVKVHTAYGETYGFDHVMRNSVQRMTAFPNRGGGHDDVIWEPRGATSFISSHRVLNNATHLGPWTYGPATGRNWVNRGVAHCLVRDAKVVEEWVVRDEFAVLQDLGLDPFVVAADLLKRSPVLGRAMDMAAAPIFGASFAAPLDAGLSGRRPAQHREACAMVLALFDQVWNERYFDRVPTFFDPACACQTVRMRRAMGINPVQMEIMNLLSAVPDGVIDVCDLAAHRSADLGLRVAAIWRLRGTYSGAPLYGPPNGAPLTILGASHFEFRRGRIAREWRIFDEIAAIAQILAGAKAI